MKVYRITFTLDVLFGAKCEATMTECGAMTYTLFHIPGLQNRLPGMATASPFIGGFAMCHPNDKPDQNTALRVCMKRALLNGKDTSDWDYPGGLKFTPLGRGIYNEFRAKMHRGEVYYSRLTNVVEE